MTLAQLRQASKLSIRALARQSQTGKSRLAQIDHHPDPPITLQTLSRLAGAFGVPRWELLRRLDEVGPASPDSERP
jgi:transcriptional regulator with XRE-family HTH domain